jgi:hypothetical protein
VLRPTARPAAEAVRAAMLAELGRHDAEEAQVIILPGRPARAR